MIDHSMIQAYISNGLILVHLIKIYTSDCDSGISEYQNLLCILDESLSQVFFFITLKF